MTVQLVKFAALAAGALLARATASPRDRTPNLDRIADTCRSTAFVERNSRVAIAEFQLCRNVIDSNAEEDVTWLHCQGHGPQLHHVPPI
jgi:hypothetical protein